jgi:gluconolactonase
MRKLFALILFPFLAFSQSGLIADGAKLTLVSDQFSFTEGPAVDKKGNVFFTDQPNDKIWKYDTKGKLSLFLDKTGRSNGLFFDQKGNLIACADENNQLWSFDKKGKPTVLVKDFDGKLLNGPNDVWVDNKGGMYFSDPFYKRDYWKRGASEQEQRLYYRDSKGNVSIAAADFQQPNGLVGNKEFTKLFVADIRGRKTYSFDIQPDGKLTNKQLFCEMGSDGMTIDEQGNIYLTGRGVTVFDKTGKQIEKIEVPQNWTANITFGGKDRKTLFITASKAAYTLQMNVKGAR